MNGIELSRRYYEECVNPMLERDFSDILPYIAVGFVGSGSERFGFDDEISTDHDFEPGCCIFLPDESKVDERRAFRLERSYAKLPNEFCGFTRQKISPVGGNRNGVFRTEDFYRRETGCADGRLSVGEWLSIPDYVLAQATNGCVFVDNFGEFSEIRQRLVDMPEDIRLKKIAGNVLTMAQSGQYNYLRCIKHGEYEGAVFACNEFVRAAMKTVFLLNRKYMPFYKWSFRALKTLPVGDTLPDMLSFLILGDNSAQSVEKKYDTIEAVGSLIIDMLQQRRITKAICADLEKHAYSVNDMIKDGNIRNMSIFAGL